MNRRLATGSVAVGVFLALSGCLSSTNDLGSTFVASGTICADGGSLTVQAATVVGTPAAALAGTSITVPAGALAVCTDIQIGLSNTVVAPAGGTPDGPVVDFEPAGTTFSLPATVLIPVTSTSSTTPQLVEGVEPGGSSETLSVQAVANGLATFQSNGLGLFGAFHPPNGGSSGGSSSGGSSSSSSSSGSSSGGSSSGGSSSSGSCAMTVTPTSQSFGSSPVDVPTAPAVFTLTSSCATGPVSLEVTGPDAADFAIQTAGTTCSGPLSGACVIAVTFNPSINGNESATLTVSANPGGVLTVPLTGTGCTGVLSITPASYDFGSITTGTTSAGETFTITNTGCSPTGALAVSLVGGQASEFVIGTGAGDTCTAALNPGDSCNVTVTFAPGTQLGPAACSLAVSATPGGLAEATLSGTAVTLAQLACVPASEDFGVIPKGQSSAPVTFTCSNSGGAATGILTASIGPGINAGDFTISGDGCSGSPLAAGAHCSLNVIFTPSTNGTEAATLQVTDGTLTAALELTGGPCGLVITPNPENFGQVLVGNASLAQTFTVTNTCGSPTAALADGIAAGANAADFVISADTCAGNALAANASCTLDVTFDPSTSGQEASALDVTAGALSANAGLTGSGAAAANLAVMPASENYGTITAGSCSAPVTFTVSNSGGLPTNALTASTVLGANAADFVISADTCAGAPLAAGAQCQLDVTFCPSTHGPESATLDVTDGTQTATGTLDGVGEGQLSIAPNPGTFGPVAIGSSSVGLTFTVTNNGTLATGVLTSSISSTNASDFTIASDGCTGFSLNAGLTCQLDIVFTPPLVGAATATLTVTDGTPANTATDPLSGTGLLGAPDAG